MPASDRIIVNRKHDDRQRWRGGTGRLQSNLWGWRRASPRRSRSPPAGCGGKGRSLEPELGGGSLDDGRDIAGGEAAIRDALRALVEDATEDSALGDPGAGSKCLIH
jgi:hypothetical protein